MFAHIIRTRMFSWALFVLQRKAWLVLKRETIVVYQAILGSWKPLWKKWWQAISIFLPRKLTQTWNCHQDWSVNQRKLNLTFFIQLLFLDDKLLFLTVNFSSENGVAICGPQNVAELQIWTSLPFGCTRNYGSATSGKLYNAYPSLTHGRIHTSEHLLSPNMARFNVPSFNAHFCIR